MSHMLLITIGIEASPYDEELAGLCKDLREEILDLDVEDVSLAECGPAPRGAKGQSSSSIDTLLVTLSNSAVIVALVGLLQSWIRRGAGRHVILRLGQDVIEVRNGSSEQETLLVKSWLDHHDP